jgi:hypothetical protein
MTVSHFVLYHKPGDHVEVTAGVPFDVPGTTNNLKVETV